MPVHFSWPIVDTSNPNPHNLNQVLSEAAVAFIHNDNMMGFLRCMKALQNDNKWFTPDSLQILTQQAFERFQHQKKSLLTFLVLGCITLSEHPLFDISIITSAMRPQDEQALNLMTKLMKKKAPRDSDLIEIYLANLYMSCFEPEFIRTHIETNVEFDSIDFARLSDLSFRFLLGGAKPKVFEHFREYGSGHLKTSHYVEALSFAFEQSSVDMNTLRWALSLPQVNELTQYQIQTIFEKASCHTHHGDILVELLKEGGLIDKLRSVNRFVMLTQLVDNGYFALVDRDYGLEPGQQRYLDERIQVQKRLFLQDQITYGFVATAIISGLSVAKELLGDKMLAFGLLTGALGVAGFQARNHYLDRLTMAVNDIDVESDDAEMAFISGANSARNTDSHLSSWTSMPAWKQYDSWGLGFRLAEQFYEQSPQQLLESVRNRRFSP